MSVEARILLQNAIIAEWEKEGEVIRMAYTLSGIAADLSIAAIAARDARITKMETVLRNLLRSRRHARYGRSENEVD